MKSSNVFTVKRYEVELMPVFNEATGKYVEEASNRVGFGVSNSPKKAWEIANKMYNKTSNGGTPVLGSWVMMKGNVKIKEARWDKWTAGDERQFQSFLKNFLQEEELERLIAEEEGLK